MLFVTYQL